MSLLSVNHLRVHIPQGPTVTRAVDGLDFTLGPAEVLGLVGESGCGKSMTALALMGLQPPAAKIVDGSIEFEGKNLLTLPDSERRKLRGNRMSMIFQEPMTSLNPVLTVGRQISELFTLHRGLSKKAALDAAVELLARVKVPSPGLRASQYPHQMSGGMRQRVMISMAIACQPALIIADEPTTALDVTIQAQIMELLDELRTTSSTSMLFITHDLGLVSEIAGRIIVMYAGVAMEEAPADLLFRQPRHPYTIGLLDSLPSAKGRRLSPIPGFVPTADHFPPGCRFSPRCRFRIDECDRAEPAFVAIADDHRSRCIRACEVGRV